METSAVALSRHPWQTACGWHARKLQQRRHDPVVVMAVNEDRERLVVIARKVVDNRDRRCPKLGSEGPSTGE